MRVLTNAILFLALLAGCEPPVVPPPIAGGGVRGEPGDETSVLVLELDSGILDVPVLGGEGGDATELGRTDAQGFLLIPGDVDVVSAFLPGKTAVTIAGAGAEVITIALEPSPPPESGTVLVSLDDWNDIPLDGADYLIARGGFTPVRKLDARENRIPPLADGVTECVRTAAPDACDLRFAVREGQQRVFVAIARGTDTGVVGDPTDDTLEPVAIRVSETVDVRAGSPMEVAVAEVGEADLVRATVSTSGTPPGLNAIVGVPGASSDDGVIVWPFGSTALIPTALGGTSTTTWAIGTASGADTVSRSIMRMTDFTVMPDFTLVGWRAPPNAIRIQGRTIEVDGEHGGVIERVDVFDESGALVWSGIILDRRGSIAVPMQVELPSAGLVRATFTPAARDTQGELSFGAVEVGWTQRASRDLAFTGCPWSGC